MISPLLIAPLDMLEAATSPSSISAKYSADENCSATWAMLPEKPISSRMPMDPPVKDAMVVISSATPARPCRAMG